MRQEMTLLKQIQDAAVRSDSGLGELLRRCKVLASRLGSKELEDWLIGESNGYPSDAVLPKYRVWGLDLKGNFVGPAGAQLLRCPIPTTSLPEAAQEAFGVFRCTNSVAAIEQMLAGNNKGVLQAGTGDLQVIAKVAHGFTCLQAWGEFGRLRLIEVLNAVRNRILDFALAIAQEDPNAGEEDIEKHIEPSKVLQIVNMTVLGNFSGIVGTVNDSVVQMQVNAGDVESLSKYLGAYGVADADLDDLKVALRESPAPAQGNAMSPQVGGWIGKMVGKAAEGAWKVGTDVAASILTRAICSYYGLPQP